MRVLFLTWDGPQQSYLESLFFPIFAGLSGRGIDVHTLQLTWATESQLQPAQRAAARLGVRYTSARLPPSIRKLGLPLVMAFGAAVAQRYTLRNGVDVLFPRSLIPMAMALLVKGVRPSTDLVFEADGLMADERADFGGWSRDGARYRFLRRVEAEGVRRARSVVCRTEAARAILVERSAADAARIREKIFVTSNAKDPREFSPGTPAQHASTRARFGVPVGAPWVVYVGSIGPQYQPVQMIAAMARIRHRLPAARFSLFTYQEQQVRSLLTAEPELAQATRVERAAPSEIPSLLGAADLGFALRLDAFSQRAVCPIKVAEYLLCGLPVVTSPIGDLPVQLAHEPSAFLTAGASSVDGDAIADWFASQVLPRRDELRESARAVGSRWFDLASSIDGYERVLRFRAATGAP